MTNEEQASRAELRRGRRISCYYCRDKKVRCDSAQPCSKCRSNNEECIYATPQPRPAKKAKKSHNVMEERLRRIEQLLQSRNSISSSSDVLHITEPRCDLVQEAEAGNKNSFDLPMAWNGSELFNGIANAPDFATGHFMDFMSEEVNTGTPASHQLLFSTTSDMLPCEGNTTNLTGDCILNLDRPMTGAGSRFGQVSNVDPVDVPSGPLATITPTIYSLGAPRDSPPKLANVSIPSSGTDIETMETPVRLHSMDIQPRFLQSGESAAQPEDSFWEYHGPLSYLSICSNEGLDWVAKKSGTTAFGKIAKLLTAEVMRQLKLDKQCNPQRAPEPDPTTAWSYCQTYFEESPDAFFGIVPRSAFESRLLSQSKHNSALVDDDPSWYALQNTIYAAGCRIQLSSDDYSSTFTEAHDRSWVYFQNALSVLGELLYSETDLMAVQALTAMSFFAEGLDSPALESMLICNTVRLAQSKGLHREPLSAWKLDQNERTTRDWLFWAIYSYEKHIAYRYGRPSSISDNDITCCVPTIAPQNSDMNVEFFTHTIKHARISSLIIKQLASAKTFRKTAQKLIQVAKALNEQLDQWRQNLPTFVNFSKPVKASHLPHPWHVSQVLYLKYAFHGSLIAIHSIFAYPWLSQRLCQESPIAVRRQIQESTEILGKAARVIILTSNHSNMNAFSFSWQVVFFPIVGMINLFVYILKDPTLSTAQSDVALLAVIGGHFARLEFVSSAQVAFPFLRDVVSIARDAVQEARVARDLIEYTIPSHAVEGEHQIAAEALGGYITRVTSFGSSRNTLSAISISKAG